MRVLVLGGYGLIGLEIVRVLSRAGHEVMGFGRSEATGRRLAPHVAWRTGDLRRLRNAEDWARHLAGIDAVVNAAGAVCSTFSGMGAIPLPVMPAIIRLFGWPRPPTWTRTHPEVVTRYGACGMLKLEESPVRAKVTRAPIM